MASFDKETAVLRFRLPWHDDMVGAPSLLLWPVLGWRVVAPRSRHRKLNMLQKPVLGLCRVGRPNAEQMAKRLHLGREAVGPGQFRDSTQLVAFIVTELQQLGWLDGRGSLTPAGLKVLEAEESEPADEQTVGWVFSDPYSGEVWPRFAAGELPFADTEPNEDGFPSLVGSRGEGRNQRAFALLPRNNEVVARTPTGEDVVRACRAHRRQYGWESDLSVDDAPAVSRVSFVSNDPSSFLVVTRAWRDKGADWHVDDPFGIGESLRLRRQIEDRFDSNVGLRKWLAGVAGGDVLENDIAGLQSRARWDVETRLTSNIHRWSQVEDRLVAMQRARFEVDLDGCPLDKWDDVALKAQKAAERVLLELNSRWTPRTRLSRDAWETNEQLLAQLARDAGFQYPLPKSLIKVKTGKIHAAQNGSSGGLRPLALLGLLGTPGCPDHPYLKAGRAAPDLLHRLNDLGLVRDEAGHEYAKATQAPAARMAFQQGILAGVETAFDLAHHLLVN